METSIKRARIRSSIKEQPFSCAEIDEKRIALSDIALRNVPRWGRSNEPYEEQARTQGEDWHDAKAPVNEVRD